ncbi:MAG: nitroreductase/quinone reductase family protein [Thermomicrobiales bacterium]
MKLQRLYNPLVRWLLRSPLHRLLSDSTLLLTYTGRHSGTAYSVPVNYVRDGETLLLVGGRDHAWWRSLRAGVPVTVRLQGRDYAGTATAFERGGGGRRWRLAPRCYGACRSTGRIGTPPSTRRGIPGGAAELAGSPGEHAGADRLTVRGRARGDRHGDACIAHHNLAGWIGPLQRMPRWVTANAVGGRDLGGTALVAATLFPVLGEGSGLAAALAVAAVSIRRRYRGADDRRGLRGLVAAAPSPASPGAPGPGQRPSARASPGPAGCSRAP